MGASIIAYWPGITEEQIEAQPGFWNDDKAWGDFMAEREDEPELLQIMRDIGAGALLTLKTDGWEDEDVDWVAPRELYNAASQLQSALKSNRPGMEGVLAVYGRNANNVDPVELELLRDLEDIKALASWAEQEGAEVMTLEVNW